MIETNKQTISNVNKPQFSESLKVQVREKIRTAFALDEKFVNIEENAEVMWYKWKKVHINLPKCWKFEWFKFDCFVSDNYVTQKDFDEKLELEKKSYSMNDVQKLLKAMNEFMAALECDTDWNMEYENEFYYLVTKKWECDALDFYTELLKAMNASMVAIECESNCNMEYEKTYISYWLSDMDVEEMRDSFGICYLKSDHFYGFYSTWCGAGGYAAYLCLRLSD